MRYRSPLIARAPGSSRVAWPRLRKTTATEMTKRMTKVTIVSTASFSTCDVVSVSRFETVERDVLEPRTGQNLHERELAETGGEDEHAAGGQPGADVRHDDVAQRLHRRRPADLRRLVEPDDVGRRHRAVDRPVEEGKGDRGVAEEDDPGRAEELGRRSQRPIRRRMPKAMTTNGSTNGIAAESSVSVRMRGLRTRCQ